MDYSRNRASAIRAIVAPDTIWTLRNSIEKLLMDLQKRLPKKAVSKNERQYPKSPEGLRAFLNAFFARHYFQVQDSLIEYFASPAFESAVQRGSLHIADIGSGPAIVPLAIADLADVTLEIMNETGKLRGNSTMTIHCDLNDTCEICLTEGQALLKKYNRISSGKVAFGRIIPLSTPFPKSNMHFRRIAHMTSPYDICSLAYILDGLAEDMGVGETAKAIHLLSQTVNSNNGQLLLIQDKFRKNLYRRICRALNVPAEMAELKQRIYDSENQNSEHTYTYCRSCSTVPQTASGNLTVAKACA